jgi:osmotically-inducible protein OsmY
MRKVNGFAATLTALVVAAACNTTPKTEKGEPATPRAQQGQPGQPGGSVSDAMIVTTIQSKYYGSSTVKGRNIDVDAENGVVTLTGKVDTDMARQEAVQLARGTSGVNRVEDRLTVASDADHAVARSAQPDAHSPAWITAKIQAQYFLHPGLKPWNIDVTTSPRGAVTLTGVVDNEADHSEAVKIARATEGATAVSDHLRVKGETAPTGTSGKVVGDATDSWITAKIQSRYFVDDEVKGRNINVDTQDGVVTLRGTVNSYSERLLATSIARNTDGVREVHDEMTIGAPSRDNDRTGAKARETVGTTGQKIEDAWITTKIQSKFFVDDQVKARKVDVDTKNGVVTLRGSVATDAAKKAAENLAVETDGVTRVNNLLKVDPSA